MHAFRLQAWRNPATWYGLAGAALIAASLWTPWWSASRTARVESRADRIADLLLQAVPDGARLDAAGCDHVLARFFALADADGVFFADLERVEPPPEGTLLCLVNKHYAFHLAVSPIPADVTAGRDTTPSLEVLAWPLAVTSPGHSVYFYAEDAPRAYTRNLAKITSGFVALEKQRPLPGVGQRPFTGAADGARSYRGITEDRWILY
jgi:hypothetical protein